MDKAAAQAQYRMAWEQYCFSADDLLRSALEQLMDEAQPDCTDTRDRGPEWDTFIATLPGYTEFWARLTDKCNAMLKKIKSK